MPDVGFRSSVRNMGRRRTKTSKENKNDITKRPPNAFMLFCRDVRSVVPRKYGLDIPKFIGLMWKSLPFEGKKEYFDRAEKLNEVHRSLNPDFVAPNFYREEYGLAPSPKRGEDVTTKTTKKVSASDSPRFREEIQPIQSAPWTSPPCNVSTCVSPSWTRRGKKAIPKPKAAGETAVKSSKQRDTGPPPFIITDPTKVKFRIVPAKQPYVYISREEKLKRKESEKRRSQEKSRGNRTSSVERQVWFTDANENLSTPVITSSKRNYTQNDEQYCHDLLSENLDLLPLMPFTPNSDIFASFNTPPTTKTAAFESKKSRYELFDKSTPQQQQHFSDNSWFDDFSPAVSVSSLFSPDEHAPCTGDKTELSDWWDEFEFLCSPMSKTSISKNPIVSLSEDPLEPSHVDYGNNNSAFSSPEIPRMDTNLNAADLLELEISTSKIYNSLSDLSDSDFQVVQNLPVDDHQALGWPLLQPGRTSEPENYIILTSPELRSNMTNPEQSFKKVDFPTKSISQHTNSDIRRNSENSYKSNTVNSPVFQEDLPAMQGRNIEPTLTTSTPKGAEFIYDSDEIQLSGYATSNEYNTSDLPDLSPFLERIANMTSPLQDQSIEIIDPDTLDLDSSLDDSHTQRPSDGIHPQAGETIIDTPRTPMKATKQSLLALKQHPIQKLTSPQMLLPSRQSSAPKDGQTGSWICPGYTCPGSRSSPGKHPSSGRSGTPLKRGRFTHGQENYYSENHFPHCMMAQGERHSLDSETQNAVEALLSVQFHSGQ